MSFDKSESRGGFFTLKLARGSCFYGLRTLRLAVEPAIAKRREAGIYSVPHLPPTRGETS